MTVADTSQAFIQSPLFVTLVGVFCVTMVTLAGAALKIVIQLTSMQSSLNSMGKAIADINADTDIMRWSDYAKSNLVAPQFTHQPGSMP
jgi:hypothetical protein